MKVLGLSFVRFGMPAALAVIASSPVVCIGGSFAVDSVSSFQTALTTAQNNGADDVITVAMGTYPVSSTLTYSSAEPHSLTITGAGIGITVLDGGSSVQVLFLEATAAEGSLTVQGLTLRHGRSAVDAGGALHVAATSGSINISQCEVTDSSVIGTTAIGGGAVALTETGNIDISNCFFRRNSAAANVGGLFASTTSGTISVSSCTFADNSVNNIYPETDYFGDGGGAMLYADGGGQVLVTSSTFIGNSTAGGDNPDGGGLMIYQLGTGASSSVTSSSFSANEAGLGGGGLFMRINATGSVTCSGNDFTDNTASIGDGGGAFLYVDTGSITVTGNTTDGNIAGGAGGGMWISLVDGNVTISGNSFAGDASGTNGGGLEVFSETATTTVTGNTITANTAGGVGAGLSYATTNGSLLLERSTFYDNTAAGDGGGLYIYLDSSSAPTDVSDLILWADLPNEVGFSTGSGSGSLTIRYSDIQGGTGQAWFGTGCIDTDPMFENATAGDLRLSWDSFPLTDATKSPGIDTGDPLSTADPDGTRADMGGLPFDQTGVIFKDGFESGNTSAWS